MTELKILMFTTFYPPYSFGGDAIGVQRMARALAARGHQVTVVHDEDSYLILGGSPTTPALGGGPATAQPSSANNPMAGCSTSWSSV